MLFFLMSTDGCLNWDYSKSYCKTESIIYIGIDNIRVKWLAKIVRATDAKIVLTSDWGEKFNIFAHKQEDKHARYLNNKLRKQGLKIYDKVDWDRFRRIERGKAIMDWLSKHPEVEGYAVIDDRFFDGFQEPEIRDHWIKCIPDCFGEEGYSGLTEDLVCQAIEVIQGKRKGPCIDTEARKIIKKFQAGGTC